MGKKELDIFKYLYKYGNEEIKDLIRYVLEVEMIKRKMYKPNCRINYN